MELVRKITNKITAQRTKGLAGLLAHAFHLLSTDLNDSIGLVDNLRLLSDLR